MANVYNIVLILTCVYQSSALDRSPPLMVKQPQQKELLFKVAQSAIENESPFIIECEAKSEPLPTYRWIKNGKNFDWQIYDDRMLQQPGRGTLVISSPRNEDIGQYQCFAENEWGIATSNSVFVRKTELNAFEYKERTTIEAREGDPFKLTCNPPYGWPKPTVYWLIEPTDGGGIVLLKNSRTTVDPDGNLWFSNVTREDASKDFTYVCAANSHFRSEFKLGNRVLLNVVSSGAQKEHEPVQQYVTRRNEVAFRGGEANLYCTYGGTPLPEILWHKDGQLLKSSDRISQQNYGRSIKIKNVSYDDKGTYTCEASNGIGEAKSHSINLDILATPYFTVEPEPVTSAEGEDVEIRCEASGNPEPTIQWIHNGKPIAEATPNDRRTVSKNSIVIKRLTIKDIGNYGCNATNLVGYIYKDVYINEGPA